MVNRKSITYVFVSFTPRSGIFFQTLQYLLNQSLITDGCLSVMNFRIFHLISTFNSLKFRVISIFVMFGRHDYPLSQFLRSDFFFLSSIFFLILLLRSVSYIAASP